MDTFRSRATNLDLDVDVDLDVDEPFITEIDFQGKPQICCPI